MKVVLSESQFKHLDQWFISLPIEEQNELISSQDQLTYLGLSLESSSFDEKNNGDYLYTMCVCNKEIWENSKIKHPFLNNNLSS